MDVMVFLFEWLPLAELCVEAQSRGMEVNVVTDVRSLTPMKDQDGNALGESAIAYLCRHGINVKVWESRKDGSIMHNKFILIDDDLSILGSYNFQYQAEEKNMENFVAVRGDSLTLTIREEFYRVSSLCRDGKAVLEEKWDLEQKRESQENSGSKKVGFARHLTRNRLVASFLFLLSISFNIYFHLRWKRLRSV